MKIINKDITTVTKGFIVHQTNCFTMGSGLAKSLYLKYPIIKEAHSKFVKSMPAIDCLGKVGFIMAAEELCICNLYGQYNYGYDGGRYTDYHALKTGLETINDHTPPFCLIYIPYGIGAGLGGGDWNVIYQIIESVFSKSSKEIFICKI